MRDGSPLASCCLVVFLAGERIVVPVLIVIGLVVVGVGEFAAVKGANGTGG